MRISKKYPSQFVVIICIVLAVFCQQGNAQSVVQFEPKIVTRQKQTQRKFVELQPFELTAEFAASGSAADFAKLKTFLENLSNYTFTSDWPGVDNLMELNTENPPFSPSQPPQVVPIEGEAGRFNVVLLGVTRGGTRGEVHLKTPSTSNGVPYTFQVGSGAAQGPIILRYKAAETQSLPAFRGKGELGFGEGGPSFDFSGSGALNGRDSATTAITSLSIAAKLPLRRPDDVRDTPGAEKDASRDIADAVELSLNSIGYRRGGHLQRLGVKARATGSLKGLEVVGYYAPITGWYNQSRGFYALEVEGGYRQGDAEFKNLTTRAADPGSVVARLGSVVEWAPQLGGVNRNLSKGLRFFVRGRGWLDTYRNSDDKLALRFRPFVDSELFFNFSNDNRIFLRGEYGSLPPDLTGRSSRIYAGVGKAF